MADNFRDPVIQKLIDTLNTEGPDELRGKYYNGDVLLAPKSELPICSIARDRTTVTQASNTEDDNVARLVINILYDWTRDLTDDYDLEAGVSSLYKLVEKRDPATYALLPGSIMYVLRANQQLDDKFWLAVGPSEVVEADYGLGIERRGPGIFSVEAVIRVGARIHTTHPGM